MDGSPLLSKLLFYFMLLHTLLTTFVKQKRIYLSPYFYMLLLIREN
jgi:hypothetical protein